MKKFFTLLICIGFLVSANAQNSPFKMSNEEQRIEQMSSKVNKLQQVKQIAPLPEIPKSYENVDIVDVIDIGTASNAFGYSPNLSYLWVDPVLNTVTNIHGFGNDIAYDISTNGGMDWSNNILVYEGEGSNVARYYNHCIFNPDESTDPTDAYVSFFAISQSGDPDQPAGYLHGRGSIGDTLNKTTSIIPSDANFYQRLPLGYDLTSEGNIFAIDANIDWSSGEADYRDSLIITKGSWDDDQEGFTYVRENLEAIVVDEFGAPVDYKVAFGPDGQTGYIVMLADNGEAEQVEGFKNLYPIYWKTTDAGDTWEGPEVVQLDGPNGVDGIVNHHLTDQQIEDLFGNDPPPREEISYTTAYDCEIAVDKYDRLHIAVVIGPTGIDPYSIVTAPGYIAACDLFIYNESQSFCAIRMGTIRTFRGVFGEIMSIDNRIQITTNPDHDLMFVSWLDTDLEEEDDNSRPNIWCRGFDPFSNPFMKTTNPAGEDAPTNVTNFSQGMWQAYLASAPKYTFVEDESSIIPYVYLEFNPEDESQDVQFKYIQNFRFNHYNWTSSGYNQSCVWVGVGIEEWTTSTKPLFVIGNYPNPFSNETNIRIELFKANEVDVVVTSITGQQLLEKDFGKLNQGQHDLKLELNYMSSGIYFYTVIAGNERVTRKMVVE